MSDISNRVLLTADPISAHTGGTGEMFVIKQLSGTCEVHTEMCLSENGFKIFREVIEDPDIQSNSPELIECLKKFLAKHFNLENLVDLSILANNAIAINEKTDILQRIKNNCCEAIEYLSQINPF